MLFHYTGHEVKFLINLTHLSVIYKKNVVDISRSNPHFVLIIGNFNPKSSNWPSNNTTTAEGF